MMHNPPQFVLEMIETNRAKFERLEILRQQYRSLKRIPNGVFIREFPEYYQAFREYKNPLTGMTREEKSIQLILNSED